LRQSTRAARVGLLLTDGPGLGALPGVGVAVASAVTTLTPDKDLLRAACLPGFTDFLAGGKVRAEEGVFWAPAETREEIVRLVREEFRHPSAILGASMTPENDVRMVRLRRPGERLV